MSSGGGKAAFFNDLDAENVEESLEDKLFYLSIDDLRATFDKADSNGTGTLLEDEFFEAFGSFMGISTTKTRLKKLFDAIDANANGEVDWAEFYTYLFLEKEGQRKMREDIKNKEFVPDSKVRGSRNRAVYHDTMIQKCFYDMRYDEFYTQSLNSVKVWGAKKLNFIHTIHKSDTPITGIVVRSDQDRLYVSDLSRNIYVYNVKSGKVVKIIKGKLHSYKKRDTMTIFQARSAIQRSNSSSSSSSLSRRKKKQFKFLASKLPNMIKENVPIQFLENFHENPQVMSVYTLGEREVLFLGMQNGNIKLYDISPIYNEFREEVCGDPLKPFATSVPTKKKNIIGGWSDQLGNTSRGVSALWPFWQYRSMFVGSWDGNIRLLRMDTLECVRTFESWKSKKPIYSLQYSPSLNVLASCGREKAISLWNPMIQSSIVKLTGHRTPVIDVAFCEDDNLLLSLGQNKIVRVWDCRTYRTLQIIREKKRLIHSPENNFSALAFNSKDYSFCACSNKLHRFVMRRSLVSYDERVYQGTVSEISGILYNENTGYCLTSDKTTIHTFDLDTGRLIFKFPIAKGVSFIAFDDTKRRVMVCVDHRRIHAYNYLNGQLLRVYYEPSDLEVNCVTHVLNSAAGFRFMVTGGWGRRVVVFNDSDNEMRKEMHMKKYRKLDSDIINMVFLQPNSLVLAHLDGSLTLMDAQTGFVRLVSKVRSIGTVDLDCPRSTEIQHVPLQIERIMGLKTNPCKIFITLRGNGVISFWYIANLQHVFDLCQDEGLITMDVSENLFVTADINGKVSVYNISKILSSQMDIDQDMVKLVRRFRTKQKKITHVKCIEEKNMVVVGSKDSVVAVYTLEGTLVGFLGQDKKWDLTDPDTYGRRDYLELKTGTSAYDLIRSESEHEMEEEMLLNKNLGESKKSQ